MYSGELGHPESRSRERSGLDLGAGLQDVFGRFWSESARWELLAYSLTGPISENSLSQCSYC